MANHIFSLLCQKVIRDGETGQASFIDALEGYTIDGDFPAKLPVFHLFSRWEKESNEERDFITRVTIKPPDKKSKKLLGKEIVIEFPVKTKIMNVSLLVENFIVKSEGYFEFFVEFKPTKKAKWKVVARLPMRIHSP